MNTKSEIQYLSHMKADIEKRMKYLLEREPSIEDYLTPRQIDICMQIAAQEREGEAVTQKEPAGYAEYVRDLTGFTRELTKMQTLLRTIRHGMERKKRS